MAQDIEIANAQYNDVPSIEVPKQGGGVAVFTDTADADAVADDLAEGKTAYVNGIKLTGTGTGGGGNYVTLDTDQNVTGTKTFVGSKKVGFKQSANNDKLGFTLYGSAGTERGYLEFNPTNTIDDVAGLMTLGNYATSANAITHVGFRRYSSVSGANGAYNILTPLIADAKSPFSLTTNYTNFYIPLGITDGTTMVKTDKRGVLDISSLLPSLPTASANTLGGVKVGNNLSIDANGVLSATGGGGGSYTAGDGIDITNGVISLETASANDIGGVKVGDGLSIDANGVLSAVGGVQTTVLWEDNAGCVVGDLTLNDSYKNYDLFAFNVAIPQESPTSNSPVMNPVLITKQQMEDSKVGKFSLSGWGNRSNHFIVVDDTTLRCTLVEQSQHVYKIYGIKIGGSSLASQIASLEARIQALESQLGG